MQAKLIKDKKFDISIVKSESFSDERGNIEKIFYNFFSVKETTITFAKMGSIRGMHFQKYKPQTKMVKVLSGTILDVCLDLRKNSSTYKKVFSKLLKKGDSIIIPKGYAHGYQAIVDSEILIFYDQKTIANFSSGYAYNSKSIKNLWYKQTNMLVSHNDKKFKEFND